MSSTPKVLAVIPARGGSKGVPRKNVRLLCGRPLISYTIECANAVRELFHRVVVSTDDEEIAAIARRYGADVPFLRPAELARDDSPAIPVVQHAVSWVESHDGLRLDWVLLLQPTEPFRDPRDIRRCLELASADRCDSVISVVQVFAVHPILMKRIEGNRLLPFCLEEKEGTRRQDYRPAAYMRNGAIYLTRRDVLMEQGSIWGATIRPYVMSSDQSVSIDTELDLKVAEVLMAERLTTSGSARP
ncbi:MAG TPA: acylneuraminate cytidylyltransferase family protein [Nitrospiraceae bacterium]|nr:acylneuraminate cytidylyltransferase family protein [Nitrospiraceae bacterium]